MNDSKTLQNIDKKLSALIGLLASNIISDSGTANTIVPEVILSNAGLENREISQILDRKIDTVQKAIKRYKLKK